MKLLFSVVLMTLFFLLINCKKSTSPYEINYNSLDPEDQEQIQLFHIDQMDYNKLKIYSSDEILLKSKSIKEVILHLNSNFSSGDSIVDTVTIIIPTYKQVEEGYKLSFEFNQEIIDNSPYCDLTLSYLDYQNNIFNVDTLFPIFKYPYETAEIFMTVKEFTSEFVFDIIDLNAEGLYYMSFSLDIGKMDIKSYNFQSETTEKILSSIYSLGCTRSSNYIYSDFVLFPNLIEIFDIDADSSYLIGPYGELRDDQGVINGLSVYNDELYVLYKVDQQVELVKLDQKGNFISSISYPKITFDMTFYDDILYSLTPYPEKMISRYDMNSSSFLSNVPQPTQHCRIISIVNDKAYFYDGYMKIILEIPLTEFN